MTIALYSIETYKENCNLQFVTYCKLLCNEAPLATKLYCILKYLWCDIGKVLNGIEIPKSRERGLGIQKKERGYDPICPRTCRAASGTMKLAGKRPRIILLRFENRFPYCHDNIVSPTQTDQKIFLPMEVSGQIFWPANSCIEKSPPWHGPV